MVFGRDFGLFARLRRLVWWRHEDAALAEEIEAHIAERIDDLVEGGMHPVAARQQAHREFGSVARHLEDSRAVWMPAPLGGLWQDLRFALRRCARQPGFSLAVTLILAVGIGLVTGFFTIVNREVLRPWPVPASSSLLLVEPRPAAGQRYGVLSHAEYRYLREQTQSFSHLAAWTRGGHPVRYNEHLLPDVQTNFVTASYFDALRIRVQRGRGFTADDEDYGTPRAVAIISDRLWERSGRDPSIVGSTIHVGATPFIVIGVAARGFTDVHGIHIDLWMPLPALDLFSTNAGWLWDPGRPLNNVVGRLRPGSSARQAEAEMDVLSRQFREAAKLEPAGIRLTSTRPIDRQREAVLRQLPVMGLLLGAMLLVMLLASANAGNLLLARGLAQRREIAVRLWLGAGRARVLRGLLIEALLLCGAAGALALVIAFAGPRLFLYTVNNDLVQVDAFAPDAVVFLFAIAMSLVACVIAGLVPALRVTRHVGRMRDADLNASLSGAGRVRGTLLAMQVALVMVLLVSAGLLTRSVTHALSADVGFAAIDDVRVLSIGVPDDLRPRVADMAPALHAELTAGWPSALAFSDTPVVGIDPNGLLAVRRPGDEEERPYPVERRQVSPGYFGVLGIAMLDGRPFTDGEGVHEIVLNESAARLLWPGGRAVGQQLIAPVVVGRTVDRNAIAVYDIVGLVRDVPVETVTASTPVVYMRTQAALPTLVVRSQSPVETERRIVGVIETILPGAQVTSRSLREVMRSTMGNAVMGGRVAWVLGLLGIVLATTGVAGVFAFIVEERRRDIGIRMALGARASQVVRLVLADASRPLLAGLLAGLLLSLGAATLLRGYLYGISPLDPLAYFQVAAILALAALVASWFPARRATRIDPAITLKAE